VLWRGSLSVAGCLFSHLSVSNVETSSSGRSRQKPMGVVVTVLSQARGAKWKKTAKLAAFRPASQQKHSL
jgi:hypothetical protein